MNYISTITYYALSLVSASVNFLGSLIHWYPKLELEQLYFCKQIISRREKETEPTVSRRQQQIDKADSMVSKAHSLDEADR